MTKRVKKIKVSTFTDESGQDTKGKLFVVCTVICLSSKSEKLEEDLLWIEKKSGKNEKWHEAGDKRKHEFVKRLLESSLLRDLNIYFSIYKNKMEYSKLVGSHIAKSVINYVKDKDYKVKVFIDKTNKVVLNQIKMR